MHEDDSLRPDPAYAEPLPEVPEGPDRPCRWIEEGAECYAFFEKRVGSAEQQYRCPSFPPPDRRLSHEQDSWPIEPSVGDDLEDELARIDDERCDGGRTREVLGYPGRQEQEKEDRMSAKISERSPRPRRRRGA